MSLRIVVGLEDADLRGRLEEGLGGREWDVRVADGAVEFRELVGKVGNAVVVGAMDGRWLSGEDLMAEAMMDDLFVQVVLVGEGISVRDAVDFVKSGAGDVVDLGVEGVDGVIEAVEVCLEERAEDLALVQGEGSGLN